MNASPRILVVDDDRRVRDMLRRYLEGEGFHVVTAEDAESMRRIFASEEVDLVLLDLMLPGEDGLVLAREIRGQSEVPIIMLTGRGDMVDRVVGLEMGADDYIAKPFHLREVLARMRSVLRRYEVGHSGQQDASPATSGAGVYCFAGWRLDPGARELKNETGEPVSLTSGEFDLLLAFVQRPQRTLTRDVLMDIVKGRAYEAYDRTIDAQIARLRRKIERDTANPSLIKSIRGIGYMFSATVTRG